MGSIVKSHHIYNGSLFSEYELIGQSNLMFKFKKQILVSGIRESLNGKLSRFQIKILKILDLNILLMSIHIKILIVKIC